MAKADKPKEPTSTPEEKQVSEVDESTPKSDDSSTEVRSDDSGEKLKSMESELGRMKQELGDERKKAEELNAYKLHYEQSQRQQTQQQQPEQKKNFDEQWFDKPTETFEQLSQQRDAKMMYYMAQQNAPMALATAKTLNPEAFVGISDVEVQQAIQGGVQSGTTNPGTLADPNAYIGTAWILRGQQTGFKVPDSAPAGMSPTETEKPGAPASGTDEEIPDIQGDDLTEDLIRRAAKEGVTREKFTKMMHAKREREAR